MDPMRFTKWNLQQEQQLEVSQPAVRALRALLGRTIKVKVSDGRIILGRFLCVDKDLNYVLGSSTEYVAGDIEKYGDGSDGQLMKKAGPGRSLGLVIIPGKHVLDSHVESFDEKEDLKLINVDVDVESINQTQSINENHEVIDKDGTGVDVKLKPIGPYDDEWYLRPQ